MPTLAVRRIVRLPRFHDRQHGRQPFVVDNRTRLDSLDRVKQPERQRGAVELNGKPPVRVVRHLDLLACQASCEWRRLQDQQHPVVVQGEVLRHRPRLAPGQDLVQIVCRGQCPMQILGIRRFPGKSSIIGGDEARQPCVRRLDRGNPRQPQILHQPVLQRAERAFHPTLGRSLPLRRRGDCWHR